VALETVTNLLRTETMRERKALMDEGSDAFVVLPGGIGTLEELVEMVTLKQLGYHARPIVLLDATGYWSTLMALLQRMVDERLATPDLLSLLEVVSTVTAALDSAGAGRGRRVGAGDKVALQLETWETASEPGGESTQ
jgi:uncharacterized protein (TIGR00730 family)